MRLLALDTTTPPGSLALWEREHVVLQRPVQDDRPFGECLPGVALDALAEAGWSLAHVDVFVVGRGPGSLTGLRVGIATAQGFALASHRPLVGVSALEALAESVNPGPDQAAPHLVAAWMDARRGEVFAELFRCDAHEDLRSLEGPVVGVPVDIVSRWGALASDGGLWVVGNATHDTAEVWRRAAGPAVHLVDPPPLAGVMAALGARAVARGLAAPPHAVAPLYVRRPDAVLARERRQVLAGRSDDAGPAS